jgi:hypothetical protein
MAVVLATATRNGPAGIVAIRRSSTARSSSVKRGWLLPQDEHDVVAKAKAFTGPWTHATCYDTASATGNENGPVSSVVSGLSYDPNLPLGGEAAVRDLNCNAVVPLGL